MEMLDACLNDFDRAMIEKNLSPGGSADLLAMTWLLAQIVNS
jgi:triphosphoribosyl-dephospho-CoA synthetase